jgi:hypothetical protein
MAIDVVIPAVFGRQIITDFIDRIFVIFGILLLFEFSLIFVVLIQETEL